MPMPFPYPNETNMTDIVGLAKYDNTVTGGLFFPMVLMALWVISFSMMYFVDKSKSFAASTFLIFLVSAPFWAAGLLPVWYVILMLVGTVFSVVFIKYGG